MNFTFVAEAGKGVVFDFERLLNHIIKTLDKIGIKAEHNGRNDITIDGRKVSGNAQYRHGNRVCTTVPCFTMLILKIWPGP